ncbi:MAG: hypothetical protein EON95_09825 [Caulobacteraceae bacterium]|nr:MAG: hypothetical protein EON95_09825 [Caulobacteraceae bacterium]
MTWLGLTLAMLLPAGCSMNQPPGTPKDAELAAIKTYEQVVAGDVAGLQARGTKDLQGPEAGAAVLQLQALIPKTTPTSSRTLRWQLFNGTGGEQASIVREYVYATHVALADTTLARPASGRPWQVRGFNVRVATNAELAAAKFSLAGRSPLHYLVLAGAILSPLACLFGLVTVLRAPKFKWKWAFAILSLLGFVQFSINWASGAFNVSPISFQLLGAGALSGGSAFDSWVISFSLPIGAAVGVWRARKARREATAAQLNPFDEPRTEPADS